MNRAVIRFISFLGVVGLALALVYFFAVAVSFFPQGAAISEIMVGRHEGERGWALPLVAIPYTLLVLHLLLRTRLGHWLVRRGAAGDAIAYCEERLEPTFARGRTEVESHRCALMRALLAQNRSEDARELIRRRPELGGRGTIRLESQFWRIQTALRCDDLVAANRYAENEVKGRRELAGDIEAMRSVIAAREGDEERWRTALKQSAWRRGSKELRAWALATGVARFGLVGEAGQALDELTAAAEALDTPVPGRAAELRLVEADLLDLEGRRDDARKREREAAAVELLDPRSQRLLSDRF